MLIISMAKGIISNEDGPWNPNVTLIKDGEPWFVAADVCRVLDISNNRDALSRLDIDEKGVASTDTPGGAQEMTIVNEPGLYRLVLGSCKRKQRAFINTADACMANSRITVGKECAVIHRGRR